MHLRQFFIIAGDKAVQNFRQKAAAVIIQPAANVIKMTAKSAGNMRLARRAKKLLK